MGLRSRKWSTFMISLLMLTPGNGHNRGLNEIDFSIIGGEAGTTSLHPWEGCSPVNAFSGGIWCQKDEPLPQIIWYKFPKPITVTKISFGGRILEQEWLKYAPSKYQFFGSNSDNQCEDEKYWTILFEDLSGLPLAYFNDTKDEEICNPSKYLCYGFKILDTLLGGYARMRDIRFYSRSQVNYTPKKLFLMSYPDVIAPIRRGAPNCPAHNSFGCDYPNDYMEVYSEQTLADDQVTSRFTFKSKPCVCKCLCLDDPLCQALTIIKPHIKMEAYRCLFSNSNVAFDGTTLQPNHSALSYIKRGCDRVNCSMNSICNDDYGTKAAVCECKDPYKYNGLECATFQ